MNISDKYNNHDYYELMYIRDLQRYGNLYVKFYLFETKLRELVKDKNPNLNHKNWTLANWIQKAAKNKILKEQLGKQIVEFRNNLFHFDQEGLKFPFDAIAIESILDKYIKEFKITNYSLKGNVSIYAIKIIENIFKVSLSNYIFTKIVKSKKV